MGRLRCDTKSIPGSLVLRWMDCSLPKTTKKAGTEDFRETFFIGGIIVMNTENARIGIIGLGLSLIHI